TPGAARELLSIDVDGSPAVLKLDAAEDGKGGYDCSVNLVPEAPAEAEVMEIEGVSVAFCGKATTVFAGAIFGLSPDGELTLELAEGDCSSCNHGGDDCCEDGCCDAGGGCCH
ncbi:MAG: hypothetical protein ACOX87_16030, partial [Chloroflexota bacterium]